MKDAAKLKGIHIDADIADDEITEAIAKEKKANEPVVEDSDEEREPEEESDMGFSLFEPELPVVEVTLDELEDMVKSFKENMTSLKRQLVLKYTKALKTAKESNDIDEYKNNIVKFSLIYKKSINEMIEKFEQDVSKGGEASMSTLEEAFANASI
jgi:hypothetical protein